jgi:hypothetical protein
MDDIRGTSLCGIRRFVFPRLFSLDCFLVFPNSRCAEDHGAKRSCRSDKGRHPRLDCVRSRAVCLDGRDLFLHYAATGINFAILLVHDADRNGYRVHYESAGELVSCPVGRKARYVARVSD